MRNYYYYYHHYFSEHKVLLMITLNNKCITREVKCNESKG